MKRLITAMLSATLLAFPILNTSAEVTNDMRPLSQQNIIVVDDKKTNDSMKETPDYISDSMFGKVFEDGKDEDVLYKSQMNTSIDEVAFYLKNGTAKVEFLFGTEQVSINGYLLEAKVGIQDGYHFVVSPQNFNNNLFDFINVRFTTKADEYDLMPANDDLKGKVVLSVMLKHRETEDWYYWQGELQENKSNSQIMALSKAIENGVPVTTALENNYDEIVKAANERYYDKEGNYYSEFSLTREDYDKMLADCANRRSGEENGSLSSQAMRAAQPNNPFYDDNIPNSAFQTVTNKWEQKVAWKDSTADVSNSLNYYTYSYKNTGKSTIYTSILLLQFRVTDLSGTTSGGAIKSQLQLEVRVVANETVLYDPDQGKYDFAVGLNNTVKMSPVIEIKKLGSNVGHFMTERKFGGLYCKDQTILAIKKAGGIVLGLIDSALTHGAITMTMDILDVISTSLYPETVSMGADLFTYGYTIQEQMQKFNKVVGGSEVSLDGNLIAPGNYFFVEGMFKANSVNQVKNVTWVFSAKIGY